MRELCVAMDDRRPKIELCVASSEVRTHVIFVTGETYNDRNYTELCVSELYLRFLLLKQPLRITYSNQNFLALSDIAIIRGVNFLCRQIYYFLDFFG